jgi:tetratricopeptide (TPR) repeat protein
MTIQPWFPMLLLIAPAFAQTDCTRLTAEGSYAEAERCFQHALAAHESDSTLHDFASLELLMGRPSRAEQLYRRALALRLEAMDARDPRVAATLHGLAAALQERRKYREAEDLYVRADGILEAAFGPSSMVVADLRHNLATLYRETGRAAEARPLLESAAGVYEKAKPVRPKLAVIYRNLAELEAAGGNCDRAGSLFARALAIGEAAYGPEHPQTAIILEAYGKFLHDTHRKSEANAALARARSILARNAANLTVDVSAFH